MGGNVISPVYELQPSGEVAVPTGQVFIRFAEGTDVNAYTDQIRDAGYEIAESPPYGTHAAWLQARSGKIADALSGVENLQNLPDIENVEPQMLMQRSLK